MLKKLSMFENIAIATQVNRTLEKHGFAMEYIEVNAAEPSNFAQQS